MTLIMVVKWNDGAEQSHDSHKKMVNVQEIRGADGANDPIKHSNV